MQVRAILNEISKELKELNNKVDKLIKIHNDSNVLFNETSILRLPKYLQETIIIVSQNKKVKGITAEEVSNVSKKARAIESAHLNSLVGLGYLTKERVSRKVCFKLRNKY